jgi:hypothetical protein
MKRWTLAPFAFVAAFAIGSLAIWSFSFLNCTLRSERTDTEDSVSIKEIETTPQLERIDASIYERGLEAAPIGMIRPGTEYRAGQITAKYGQIWKGLFETGDSYQIRDAKVKVKNYRVTMKDEYDGGSASRTRVGVAGSVEPLFLIEQKAKVKNGPVQTIFRSPDYLEAIQKWPDEFQTKITSLSDGYAREFQLASATYHLRVVRMVDSDDRNTLVLTLESGGVRQILHATPAEGISEDGKWLGHAGKLYWAGDLDGDERLDLHLSLFTTDIFYEAFIFTSGNAKEGQIVGKLASLNLVSGC